MPRLIFLGSGSAVQAAASAKMASRGAKGTALKDETKIKRKRLINIEIVSKSMRVCVMIEVEKKG